MSLLRRFNFSAQVLTAMLAGIGCGLFFGEYTAILAVVGEIFVGLLRMTVIPYIIVSLVASFGKLSLRQSRKLLLVGGAVLLVLWGLALVTIFALSNTFPTWQAGSFFSTRMTEPAPTIDFVSLFIPSNIFESLVENHVPAVVLLCVLVGLALAQTPNKEGLIRQLDILAKVLVRVNMYIVRLIPAGIFAIAAHTAGTLSLDELGRLQAYLFAYTVGALFLGLIALPALVASFTTFTYREALSISRDAMLTAFATGKLIVVLPMLIERTEKLVAQRRPQATEDSVPAVDILYPLAYSFPHVGKLLGILFIPFAAWFLGDALEWGEYPLLLSSGLVAYFGGPLLATPFLLDLMHLPHDMFQLFLLSGVYAERLSDGVGAMHLATVTLLTLSAFMGGLRLQWWPAVKYQATVIVTGIALIAILRSGLSNTLEGFEGKDDVLANMQLLEAPVEYVVIEQPAPNPEPRLPGESLLERIQRRGVMRVGYNEDKLPFAYFNVRGELVGYDVNMAHALARDLGVSIEFVRFDRLTLNNQVENDHFDVVMSGLVGTLERAAVLQHTEPYMDVRLALVVPDYRAGRFRSFDSIRANGDLRIGFVDLSRGFVQRLREELPQVHLVELQQYKTYFELQADELDALLISAEAGSAFTLLYPEFEVVVPQGQSYSLPLFYAVGARDPELTAFLEHWLRLRRDDGTMRQYYKHWILGRTDSLKQRRWSVIRDVLGWVD